MPIVPTAADLQSTIERMEARYDAAPDVRAVPLMATYRRLTIEFEADLSDTRDLLMAKASALMMVKYLLQAQEASSKGT